MRILVADDDPLASAVVRRALQNWGHQVVLATDGEEAFNFLQDDNSIRIAILDWQMPGLDGFELCYKIRNELNLVPFYIILLTGRTGRGNTIEGLKCGADEFLTKPVDTDLLQARLATGERSIELQSYLVARIRSVEKVLESLPVCPHCRRLQTDDGQWLPVTALAVEDFTPAVEKPACPYCAPAETTPETPPETTSNC